MTEEQPRCAHCRTVKVGKAGAVCGDCKKRNKQAEDAILRDLGKKKGGGK